MNGPVVKVSLDAEDTRRAADAITAVIYQQTSTSVRAHFATEAGQLRLRLEPPDA
jgi:hypothetical protein